MTGRIPLYRQQGNGGALQELCTRRVCVGGVRQEGGGAGPKEPESFPETEVWVRKGLTGAGE
jgi:hypothetical protein